MAYIHLLKLPKKHKLTADHLEDVLLSALADGDVLTYELATLLWKNKAPTTAKGISDMLMLKRTLWSMFECGANWVQYKTGTGSVTFAMMQLLLSTGTTSGSIAGIRSGVAFLIPIYSNRGAECIWHIKTLNVLNEEVHLIAAQDISNWALTQHQFGFKIIANSLYATCADGTTEKATFIKNVGVNYSAVLRALVDPSVPSIKYYEENTTTGAFDLKVTHTVNLPNAWLYFMLRIKNTTSLNVQSQHETVFAQRG